MVLLAYVVYHYDLNIYLNILLHFLQLVTSLS